MRQISLSEASEADLRAWVDAGYMDVETYREEMARRRRHPIRARARPVLAWDASAAADDELAEVIPRR